MDKKDIKALEKRELALVRATAKALAIVNGHSHPDDYAEAVTAAFVDPPDDVSEARAEESAKREGE